MLNLGSRCNKMKCWLVLDNSFLCEEFGQAVLNSWDVLFNREGGCPERTPFFVCSWNLLIWIMQDRNVLDSINHSKILFFVTQHFIFSIWFSWILPLVCQNPLIFPPFLNSSVQQQMQDLSGPLWCKVIVKPLTLLAMQLLTLQTEMTLCLVDQFVSGYWKLGLLQFLYFINYWWLEKVRTCSSCRLRLTTGTDDLCDWREICDGLLRLNLLFHASSCSWQFQLKSYQG